MTSMHLEERKSGAFVMGLLIVLTMAHQRPPKTSPHLTLDHTTEVVHFVLGRDTLGHVSLRAVSSQAIPLTE